MRSQLKRATCMLVFAATAAIRLIAPPSVDAGIIVDGAPSTGTATTSPATVSHTTGSGVNRLMLVSVSIRHGTGAPAVSSITDNGKALTLVRAQANPDNFARAEIWRLVAPDTGTYNVVVNFAFAPQRVTVGVMTFTGVDQSTPLGTPNSATADSAAASTTVSSAAGELVFDTLVVESSTNYDLIAGAGQTERWDLFQIPASPAATSTTMKAAVRATTILVRASPPLSSA